MILSSLLSSSGTNFNHNINVGTKMHKLPLPVMDMPVPALGSVRVLAHALSGNGNCI
jgi:hypothetical protein